MAAIRIVLRKSKKNSKGESPVVLRLADSENKRAEFSTRFLSSDKYFDTSKNGGRFFQGKGVKAFTVERKEEDGRIKVYTNKDANDFLVAMEDRAGKLIKKYTEEHINWGFERFKADFLNAPKRTSFASYAEDSIEKEYRSTGHHRSAVVASEALQSLRNFDKQFDRRSFQDINVKYLNDYMAFCRKKGNSDSTLKIRLGEIRCLFNIAIREGATATELYPFSNGKGRRQNQDSQNLSKQDRPVPDAVEYAEAR